MNALYDIYIYALSSIINITHYIIGYAVNSLNNRKPLYSSNVLSLADLTRGTYTMYIIHSIQLYNRITDDIIPNTNYIIL